MMSVTLTRAAFPAGGGPFDLPHNALGIFLDDQPSHHLAIGSDRRNHMPLRKHDGWILPAASSGLCEYDDPLVALIIDFDRSLLEEVGLAPGDTVVPRAGALDPLLLQLALGAEAFLAGPSLYRETMSRALAAQLVRAVAPSTSEVVVIEDRRLKRVVDYIHDNLAEDFSLAALSGLAAMSPFHFSRAFKAATGSSPLQYVIERRIERAKILLRTTKLSVAEIAYRSGYDDPGRFSRQFRKRLGTSPGVFRAHQD